MCVAKLGMYVVQRGMYVIKLGIDATKLGMKIVGAGAIKAADGGISLLTHSAAFGGGGRSEAAGYRSLGACGYTRILGF
jgi:hypothetical protein